MMAKSAADERLVDELVDELARCYVRAALNQLLAASQNESAAESGQDQRRREGTNGADHTPLPPPEAT